MIYVYIYNDIFAFPRRNVQQLMGVLFQLVVRRWCLAQRRSWASSGEFSSSAPLGFCLPVSAAGFAPPDRPTMP